jgi:hypothetical protein
MAVHLTGRSAVAFLLGIPLAIGISVGLPLHSTVWGVAAAAGALALMFVVAALPVKRKTTREDVARSIENFVNGRGGPWDWDDFISCRIADVELDAIRIRCLRIQSEYPGNLGQWCNEHGIDVLRDLAKQLRSKG